ncbi:MAG: penicillin-binding protein 2 [Solirubrobacterales bacterium]
MAGQSPFFRLPDRGGDQLGARSTLRIAALGVIALCLFAIVFFRLWFLQVLSGDQYLAEANQNRTRDVRVEAPRGDITDRNGDTLVDNKSSWQVRVDQNAWDITLSTSKKKTLIFNDPQFAAVLKRLSRALREPQGDLKSKMRDSIIQEGFANAVVAEDVDLDSVVKISENSAAFPHVTVSQSYKRAYPNNDLASHLFGYVREIDGDQLKSRHFEGAEQGDLVGQTGLEYEYDRYLRGKPGLQRVEVEASGKAKKELPGTKPETGDSLRLTIDKGVQEAGENAIARGSGGIPTHGSAFVAMNVHSGEILGMGSYPTYDPSVFSGVLRQSTYDRISSKDNGYPIINRTIGSVYPPGSTFKAITSIANMQAGLLTPGWSIDDAGVWEYGGYKWQNAGKEPLGHIDLEQALQYSSDIYFYQQGLKAYQKGGQIIQKMAGRLGLAHTPTIDLPNAAPGQVSNPKIIRKTEKRPWNAGDNMNASVGQGSTQASPLQMAVAYAALGNGGYVVTPHLGKGIVNSRGEAFQEIEQPARRKLDLDQSNINAILTGLHAAAQSGGGTSDAVFGDFPVQIAGKTGTAEAGAGKEDQSWYLALAPYPNPRYVVAVTVEQGGFGAEAAAPAARQILAKLFNLSKSEQQKWQPGNSHTL